MHSKPFALLAAGALAALIATGCSKGSDQSSTSTTTTTESSPAASGTTGTSSTGSSTEKAPAGTPMGDPVHGKQIYGPNCSACHGATGHEGGVGPSLTNEKSKKNYQQTIAWIHNPKAPMPKLWPSPLNDKDVQDVAAFVQTL